jgi:hypothetical protein
LTLNNVIDAVLIKNDKCIFCGVKKDWDTDFIISVKGKEKVTVTVCPKDRNKHTILELLEANIKDSYDEVKKYVEEIMKGELLRE